MVLSCGSPGKAIEAYKKLKHLSYENWIFMTECFKSRSSKSKKLNAISAKSCLVVAEQLSTIESLDTLWILDALARWHVTSARAEVKRNAFSDDTTKSYLLERSKELLALCQAEEAFKQPSIPNEIIWSTLLLKLSGYVHFQCI